MGDGDHGGNDGGMIIVFTITMTAAATMVMTTFMMNVLGLLTNDVT